MCIRKREREREGGTEKKSWRKKKKQERKSIINGLQQFSLIMENHVKELKGSVWEKPYSFGESL